MNFNKFKPEFVLSVVTVLSTLLFWSIFYFNLPPLLGFPGVTLETLYANYDGPNYMVIAKCGYSKDCIGQNFSLPLPLEYYPAHFPLYPILIRFFSFFTLTTKAMLFTTLSGSVLLTLVSFHFFKKFVPLTKAFWLTLLFIFLPARLFVLRQIGAPESWFISFILLSIIFFSRQRYFTSAIFAVLAQLLKSPGILLVTSFTIVQLFNYLKFKNSRYLTSLLPYSLVFVSILALFGLYQLQTGDFWAYFHSGDNIHLTFLPYQVFVSNRSWINTIWLEDVVYIFLVSIFSLFFLYQKYRHKIYFIFPLIFVLATVMVAHRDISRYLSPVYPFIILALFYHQKVSLIKKALFLISPAIVLFAINFCIGNTAPISNWQPYL
ncbi:MAG: hypothetical protein WC686_01770 [Candidatus Shapirobacteria bacterium]|jgi:hypothetical protein